MDQGFYGIVMLQVGFGFEFCFLLQDCGCLECIGKVEDWVKFKILLLCNVWLIVFYGYDGVYVILCGVIEYYFDLLIFLENYDGSQMVVVKYDEFDLIDLDGYNDLVLC